MFLKGFILIFLTKTLDRLELTDIFIDLFNGLIKK